MVLPIQNHKGVKWVTQHCINRYRLRKEVEMEDEEVVEKLSKWLKKSREVILRPGRESAKQHHPDAARYYLKGGAKRGDGWILVVVEETLITVHKNLSGEWWLIPKKELTPPENDVECDHGNTN